VDLWWHLVCLHCSYNVTTLQVNVAGVFFRVRERPWMPLRYQKIDGEAAVWGAYRVWYRSPIPTCCTVWPTEKSQAAHRYRLKSPTLPPCLKITTSDNWSHCEPALTRAAGCRQEPTHQPDGRRTAPAFRALSAPQAAGSSGWAGTGPLLEIDRAVLRTALLRDRGERLRTQNRLLDRRGTRMALDADLRRDIEAAGGCRWSRQTRGR
jgi:hypothetical protein